jgi:hypothetical protein
MGSSTKEKIDRVIIIANNKDKLVEMVEEFFKERSESEAISEVVPIKKNQFENVLRMSMISSSVGEVINFIRYQIGRAKTNEGWRNAEFGENLISKIQEVAKIDPSVKIELVRLFLGFLNRQAVYERAQTGDQDDE